jgi:hypothetical protein
MSLRNLSLNVQIAEGLRLCDTDAPHYHLITRDALVLAATSRVRTHTHNLITFQHSQGQNNERIQALISQMGQQDAINDNDIGCIDDVLGAAIKIIDEPDLLARLQQAHALIFASGRRGLIVGQYGGMAGEASRIRAALRPEHFEALDTILIHTHSLGAILRRWLDGCARLTALDQERRELLTAVDHTRQTKGDLQTLRNQWVRAMSLLLAAIEDSEHLDDHERTILLASLRESQRRAAR